MALVPGVAVDGVKFKLGTAETVTCDGGQVYCIEGLRGTTAIPSLWWRPTNTTATLSTSRSPPTDTSSITRCSVPISPPNQTSNTDRTGTGCVATKAERHQDRLRRNRTRWHQHLRLGVVDPSYGNLDACNGTTIDGDYLHLKTGAYPFVERCLKVEFSETGPGPDPAPDAIVSPGTQRRAAWSPLTAPREVEIS